MDKMNSRASRQQSRLHEIVSWMQQIHAEDQGVFKVELIRQDAGSELTVAVFLGDVRAAQLITAVGQFLRRLGNEKPPCLCLLCPAEFSAHDQPATIAIVTAHLDTPTLAMMSGICVDCAEKSEADLRAAILDTYREGLIPDAREISPSGEVGRA